MALTAEQEKGVVAMLAAFQNGKRINELDAAKGALKDMRIEVMDETGETHSMELADAVAQAGNPIAGRYWNTANATPTAAGYYGSLQALRDLPAKLGLGRYLVTDDRKKRKLDPTDSTKYADGSPAALDGSQGQCMWCWNGFIANIFNEGGVQVKCITFDKPVGNGVSIRIPAGGTSWLGAGVMDRTNQLLCSVISNAEQFRGGGGSALKASSYTKAPKADAAQLTMLGMPATNISTTSFGTYARKRGEGWDANWFVAQFVVEFLFEVIMGTQNSQATFNADKDANGLYQGGFGTGVTDMPDWGNYNGYYPVIPTSVGLEAGDGVCLVDYKLPDATDEGTYKAFKVPVFFGLVHAGYGSLWRWVRGLIMNAGDEKSEVYISRSMFAAFDPSTINYPERSFFSYNSVGSENAIIHMPKCIYVAADRLGATPTIPIYEDEALGGRGENVLRRIDHFRDEQLPETLRGDAEGTTLNYVLKYWLQKISPGVKFDYRIEEKADMSYSLYDNHRSANVGYGLSYSLPVIVALLTATLETESIVLIENPEAHLHPQGQAEMARLICLCVEAGAQVVVETHSDHLFDGVRIFARESENHFASKVATFWCQLDENRNTQVDSCRIQENGRLDHWPERMFDQYLLDSEKLL